MKIHVVELPLFFSFCPCVDGVSSTLVQGWTCDIDPDENKHSMPTDWASQVVLVVKNPFANTRDRRDASWIPGLGRSPGGGHGNLLQYSCLENPMDRGTWQVESMGTQRGRHLSTHARNEL